MDNGSAELSLFGLEAFFFNNSHESVVNRFDILLKLQNHSLKIFL